MPIASLRPPHYKASKHTCLLAFACISISIIEYFMSKCHIFAVHCFIHLSLEQLLYINWIALQLHCSIYNTTFRPIIFHDFCKHLIPQKYDCLKHTHTPINDVNLKHLIFGLGHWKSIYLKKNHSNDFRIHTLKFLWNRFMFMCRL